MRKESIYIFVLFGFLISGCATYAGSRYSIRVDNVTALRLIGDIKINVGLFTSSEPLLGEIECRAAGPILTPDGESFAEYIRKAFIDELVISNVFSANAPVTLTGNLDKIDFSSMDGNWNLVLTVLSSNGKSMTVTENYKYTSSFDGYSACAQTAQALMPAVQDLIGKLVRSPQFLILLSN